MTRTTTTLREQGDSSSIVKVMFLDEGGLQQNTSISASLHPNVLHLALRI